MKNIDQWHAVKYEHLLKCACPICKPSWICPVCGVHCGDREVMDKHFLKCDREIKKEG